MGLLSRLGFEIIFCLTCLTTKWKALLYQSVLNDEMIREIKKSRSLLELDNVISVCSILSRHPHNMTAEKGTRHECVSIKCNSWRGSKLLREEERERGMWVGPMRTKQSELIWIKHNHMTGYWQDYYFTGSQPSKLFHFVETWSTNLIQIMRDIVLKVIKTYFRV